MSDKPLSDSADASDARGSALRPNPVAPEYRELHELYCRCAEIGEALMERAASHLTSPLFGELIGKYANLGNTAAELIMFLQARLPADPAVFQTWREAALQSRVLSGDDAQGSQAIQEKS